MVRASKTELHVDLVGRSATDLAAAVRAGEITARDVVAAHLDQLAAVEHRLGAFTSVRREAAITDAEEVDARSDRGELALAGVPVAVSDVIDVAGSPTRFGSTATSADPATADGVAVAALRAAGAVVIGKTRVPELGVWGTADDPEGTAVSPWDPTRSAGGASGGAAAAVAGGVTPIAIGVDGFGAVRGPAAACGVVGVRPGAGHLGVEAGEAAYWFGAGRIGALATTVEDVGRVLGALGADTAPDAPEPPDTGLRVAVSWKAASPGVVVAGVWREAAIEAGRLLNHAGHQVEHRDPPYDRGVTRGAVARWTQGVAEDVAALGLDPEALQPRTRAHVAAGERLGRLSPVDDEATAAWRGRLDAVFTDVDVVVTPAFARMQPAAHAWHTRPWAANIATELSSYPFFAAWGLADVPSLTLPLWHDAGRPLSVQLAVPAGDEARLFAVAAALERMVPRARHAPGWGITTA